MPNPKMLSLSLKDAKLMELRQKLQDALSGTDAQAVTDAYMEIFQYFAEETQAAYDELANHADTQVLAARGVRQLTSQERTYWQKVGDALRSPNPQQSLSNLDVVMPKTTIDSIFDDLTTSHPLLSRIRFLNTNGAIEMMTNTNGYQEALWGDLCDDITRELFSGFKKVSAGLLKLSAFIPICKAMLDLGPEWLDRYIRQILAEALANGWERGIVAGTGNKEPIGMIRQVGDNVTITGGVYPEKIKIKVTSLSPAVIGNLLSMLAIGVNGRPRPVRDVILVVNPQNYFQKIMPATTIMGPDGTYRNDVLPYPMTIIQSAAMPKGAAAIGISSLYWAFAGMSKDGRIEYSDHYHFLEDERVYLIKTYGNGMPADNNAFLFLDISELEAASYKVTMVEAPTPSADATLSDLRVGSLTLTPKFDSDVITYAVSTTNASNLITAIPTSAAAEIQIKVNDREIDNGTAATWAAGSNTVTVKVTAENGTATKTYTITVTKTEA